MSWRCRPVAALYPAPPSSKTHRTVPPNTPNRLPESIWKSRYRAAGETEIGTTWRRVARALASVEASDQDRWERRFLAILEGFRFLPGGRILAGAGVDRSVTLLNCFVMGKVPDDLAGIFQTLKEGALTMQQGGGIGVDFSTLRPAGLRGRRIGGIASGPVSFMQIWDRMCATLLSTSARRGAMMGTLRCDHPDILAFIDAKRHPAALRNFNLSVLVTDALIDALERDASWPLLFPVDQLAPEDLERFPGRVDRLRPGRGRPVCCAVIRELPARLLWDRLMRAAYDTAEPGVLFIDQVNRENNLAYREQINATNPCGEVPLPAYGACDLGSLNLTAFVRAPFSAGARLDLAALAEAAAVATRMLDNVITLSRFPLPAQAEQARGSRRIGLGITGLADALILLGLRYDSAAGREQAGAAMRTIGHAAYRASIALAAEKGAFPFFERGPYMASPFVQRLPSDIREGIARGGIRNSHLTAIAPAGTISLIAGNLSSGIEPVFARTMLRRVRMPDGGSDADHQIDDRAVQLWTSEFGDRPGPPAFVSGADLAPADHLAMQAVLQPLCDGAIAKTINVPADIGFSDFSELYRRAHDLGLKGCTLFRPNLARGAVLTPAGTASAEPGCCPAESCR
jgi:ribonucleoside-diphosphate reductase alpha chain